MENQFRGSGTYVASEELLKVTNIAIALQKPLLVKGEPGTGKTVLAQAIANALQKRLLIWNIKSTTKAQDGLYVYDVVQRLYDSQMGVGDIEKVEKYVKLGKLGEAFSSDEQVILLIDEIDKADLEFPYDLLWELNLIFRKQAVLCGQNSARSSLSHLMRKKSCRMPFCAGAFSTILSSLMKA